MLYWRRCGLLIVVCVSLTYFFRPSPTGRENSAIWPVWSCRSLFGCAFFLLSPFIPVWCFCLDCGWWGSVAFTSGWCCSGQGAWILVGAQFYSNDWGTPVVKHNWIRDSLPLTTPLQQYYCSAVSPTNSTQMVPRRSPQSVDGHPAMKVVFRSLYCHIYWLWLLFLGRLVEGATLRTVLSLNALGVLHLKWVLRKPWSIACLMFYYEQFLASCVRSWASPVGVPLGCTIDPAVAPHVSNPGEDRWWCRWIKRWKRL